MRYKAKTSPVIRATLAAMRAVDELRDARLEAATDTAERERIQTEYWDVTKSLLTTLHEAQFGPRPPAPKGPRLLIRDGAPVTATPATRSKTQQIYQLRVTLHDSTPSIWRRLQVRGNTSLSRLHDILQIVMGWTDSHMHEFVVRDSRYGFPDMEWDPLDQPKDERRVRLGQLVPAEGHRFTYEYDFGDGWTHEIVVEQIIPAEPGVSYPRCIAGKRACPPEDVGGISGYADFLEAIRDPQHEEHDDYLTWAGGAFDPEACDLTAINRQLAQLTH